MVVASFGWPNGKYLSGYNAGAVNIDQVVKTGECGKCETIFNGTNVFKDNFAQSSGGAISFSSN
jgi:predicted outer membrane repeat protein